MGACFGKKTSGSGSESSTFWAIPDQFESITEVQDALRAAGLEASQLILGIDYTKSNTWTGAKTFGGRCLHDISPDGPNPYQSAISIIGRTLEVYDDDKMIPTFGFGDISTADKAVFPLDAHKTLVGFEQVLARYNEVTPHIQLSGPTDFAPIINKAIEIVVFEKAYHVLVIIADGQVTSEAATKDAIVRASELPLSIIVVGVGDGPWEMMEEFDDGLPTRKFDNFQFVDYNQVLRSHPNNFDAAFALMALMEIPDQYKEIRKLKLLDKLNALASVGGPPAALGHSGMTATSPGLHRSQSFSAAAPGLHCSQNYPDAPPSPQDSHASPYAPTLCPPGLQHPHGFSEMAVPVAQPLAFVGNEISGTSFRGAQAAQL